MESPRFARRFPGLGRWFGVVALELVGPGVLGAIGAAALGATLTASPVGARPAPPASGSPGAIAPASSGPRASSPAPASRMASSSPASYAALESIELDRDALRLYRRGAGSVVLRSTPDVLEGLARRIGEARSLGAAGAARAAAALERRDRPLAAWRDALRGLLASAPRWSRRRRESSRRPRSRGCCVDGLAEASSRLLTVSPDRRLLKHGSLVRDSAPWRRPPGVVARALHRPPRPDAAPRGRAAACCGAASRGAAAGGS